MCTIGEKSAVKFLQEFNSLENIYNNIEQIPDRYRSKLEKDREAAYLSYKLAAIVTDVTVGFDLEACRAVDYNRDDIAELFRELEFRSLLDRMSPEEQSGQLPLFASEQSQEKPFEKGTAVTTKAQLEILQGKLAQTEAFAVDVESTGTNALQSDLVGISLALSETEGYYIPVGHDPKQAGSEQLPLHTALDVLRGPLENSTYRKLS